MPYCDVSLVRSISGLQSEEIRDKRIRDLRDEVATPKVNDDIQTRVDREEVRKISQDKKNRTNGENTTFYLRETHDSFRELGDLNDDGQVDENDIFAWAVNNDERIDVDVTEIIDIKEGEFEAVRAEDGEPLSKSANLFVRYRHAPVNVADPNQMVAIACAQLTGAYCFSNIETKKLKNFSIGDVTIRNQSDGFRIMQDQYKKSMRQIVNREVVNMEDNENVIEDVIQRRGAGRKTGRGKNTTGRFSSG